MVKVDRTGEQFGDLTIIEMLYGYNGSRKTFVRCLCSCGNTCIKQLCNLQRGTGNPPHCGCKKEYYLKLQGERHRKEDLTGKRFGSVVVTEMLYAYGRFGEAHCKCVCDCGREFMKSVRDLQKAGDYASCGCQIRSRGEFLVSNILDDIGVKYNEQYSFDDCKYVYALKFDFYISDYNIAIEYQGRQHYEPIDYFGGEETFRLQVARDNTKRKYCNDHNITLLEIPYALSDDQVRESIINTIYPERLSQ